MVKRCVDPRDPFSSLNSRKPDGGFLAVHKQDFNAHTSGEAYRHCADQINMNPPLNSPWDADNVQETLEKIALYIGGGTGSFVTIGDGYSRGTYNIGDTGISNLNEAFIAAFADSHLQDGGVVLLLSGKPTSDNAGYTLTSTVSVPSGVSIWGEPGGVIINGRMFDQPMFRILTADQTKRVVLGYESISEKRALYSAQTTKLWNLTLISNLNRTAGYFMQSVPMISVDDGAVLKLDNVTCFGNIVSNVATADYVAISGNGLSPTSNPTIIDIEGCLIDGFSCGVRFTSDGGANDYLSVKDCRIRYFGTAVLEEDKYAINMLRCNAIISGNWLYAVNDGTFDAAGAINIKNAAVDDDDVRINIINNSGDIGDSASADASINFINTNSISETIIGIKAIGNSWGDSNPGNYIVVLGDGIRSVGDITGANSLDLVINRLGLISTKAIQSTIYLMPGNYNLTTSAVSSGISLVGPAGTSIYSSYVNILVNLPATSTDRFGRHTTIFSNLENVTFMQAGAVVGRHNSISVVDETQLFAGSKQSVVKNVIFKLPVVFDNSQTSAKESVILVDGCSFVLSSSTLPNELATYVKVGGSFVHFVNCYWSGKGYALHATNVANTASDKFRMVLENCRFFPWEITALNVPLITNVFDDNGIVGYKQRYIWVDLDIKGDIEIRNCKILGGDSTDDRYEPIDATLIDTDANNKIAAWVEIAARKIFIDGCVAEGPDHEYSTTTGYALPSFYVVPKHQTTISNSIFRGTLPLLIYISSIELDKTSNVLAATTQQVVVENNIIQDYEQDPGWSSSNVLGIFSDDVSNTVKGWQMDVSGTAAVIVPPSIVVRNNIIGHKTRTTYTIDTDRRDIPTDLATGYFDGRISSCPCQIYVPGWSSVVEGNTIYADIDDSTEQAAACAVWTQPETGVFTEGLKWSNYSVIKNNSIYLRTRKDMDSSLHRCVSLFLGCKRGNVSGNNLVFINDSAVWSDGILGWIELYINSDDTDQILYYIMTENVFHRVGEIPAGAHGIYMPTGLAASVFKGIFKNNIFTFNETSAGLQDFVNIIPAGWVFERLEPNYTTLPALSSSTEFNWEESVCRENT